MADATDIKKGHLEEEGWLRRSILDEPRLSEVLETYRSLGYEVIQRNRPFGTAIPRTLSSCKPRPSVELYTIDNMKVPLENEELNGGCAACLESPEGRFWVVYTRAGKEARDDLFE